MSSGGPAGVAVLKYLEDQNRPYSVNDIVLNLHKEHGKTAIQKALDILVQNGSVREKTYGKQKIYFVDQSRFPQVTDTEVKAIEDKVTELTNSCKENQEKIKEAQVELKTLTSSLTTEQAKSLVEKLSKETAELQKKHKVLSEAQGGEAMSKEERNKIKSDRLNAIKEWKSRKRICMGIVNTILDNCEMPKAALLEDMGIETDEDCGVKVPT